jgi:hypothetical protein
MGATRFGFGAAFGRRFAVHQTILTSGKSRKPGFGKGLREMVSPDW